MVQSTDKQQIAVARTLIMLGTLLVGWFVTIVVFVGDWSSPEVAVAAVGVGLAIFGWLTLRRDRVGKALEDIAEAIDPLVNPPHVDVPEGVDEIHAPGHAHVKRGR